MGGLREQSAFKTLPESLASKWRFRDAEDHMNPRKSLKRRLLRQLEGDMDQLLTQSRRIDGSGRTARQALLNLIMASLPKFPLELRPPALRRGDYYEEIALAMIECPALTMLDDERVRFSLYRVLRVAGASQEFLLERAVASDAEGGEQRAFYAANFQRMLELPIAVITPEDFDLLD